MDISDLSREEPSSTGRGRISRRRPITACSECTRKKQKCNREWPCNRCLARRAVHLCRYDGGVSGIRTAKSTTRTNENQIEDSHVLQEDPIAYGSEDAGDPSEDLDASYTVLGKMLNALTFEGNSLEISYSKPDFRRSRKEILKLFPSRQETDFLIQHFLAEVNWLYEEIFPQTFIERYNSWWLQPSHPSCDDIQFGVLILRLCVNSLQFLPNLKYPTDDIFRTQLDVLESQCNAAACKLDEYRPRKPSLLRIQQLLIYIATLSNSGNAVESYSMIREAVKEAQDIHLFLEEKGAGLNEFEQESRRRTFWNLYIWDRYSCTALGDRFPLIPDGYFDVLLPRETLYTSKSSDPDSPNIFTDVLLNIKLCQKMEPFLNSPAKKTERLDPIVVASHAQSFQEDFIDKLHPAFRLEDPCTRWDETIPCLALKRTIVHIGVYSVITSMHRAFFRPPSLSCNSQQSPEEEARATLSKSHRLTLVNASINGLNSAFTMHELLGGGAHRYFILSISIIEAAGVLGMCLLSDTSLKESTTTKISGPITDRIYEYFERGLRLLELLAERSPLAQKGVLILRKLNTKILLDNQFHVHDSVTPAYPRDQNKDEEGAESRVLEHGSSMIGFEGSENQQSSAAYVNPDLLTVDWDAVPVDDDFSWFLDDSLFGYLGEM